MLISIILRCEQLKFFQRSTSIDNELEENYNYHKTKSSQYNYRMRFTRLTIRKKN